MTRYLKKCTGIKFLITYADPATGHSGTIYRAAGWLYIGLSDAVSTYEVAGRRFHSRTFAYSFGSHSLKYFRDKGLDIELIPQKRKHRYIKLLTPGLDSNLAVPVLPYPGKDAS